VAVVFVILHYLVVVIVNKLLFFR